MPGPAEIIVFPIAARPAPEPGQITFAVTLSTEDYRRLHRLALGTGVMPDELAASLVAEVLADDEAAHGGGS